MTRPFIIKVFKLSNQQAPSTFYFIISSKISKKAVIRNRLKRILRECARINFKDVVLGFKVVAILQPESVNLSPTELRAKFLEILRDYKILNSPPTPRLRRASKF